MSSTPPGWHPQPDGRDRWWDGQQWTDDFRDPPPPQSGGMSKGVKGCLITAVVLVVLLLGALVVGFFVFARSVDEAVSSASSSSNGSTTVVVVPVGQAFDLPKAAIQDGWSVSKGSGVWNVDNMTAQVDGDAGLVPVIFAMKFGDNGPETVCTALTTGGGGAATNVACVPMLEEPDTSGPVTVEAQSL